MSSPEHKGILISGHPDAYESFKHQAWSDSIEQQRCLERSSASISAIMGFSIIPKHLALRETSNTRLAMGILLITFSQFNFGFDQQGFSAS